MQAVEKAYDEIVNLFARGSSPNEILHFHPSPLAQERARDLLLRNKSGDLTRDEVAELERLGDLEQIMQLVKARARAYTDSAS